MTVRMLLLGWTIAAAGAAAFHLTPSEVTIILAVIGAIVPLGVAYITTKNRGFKAHMVPREDLDKCEEENARLRRRIRNLERL